jgi:hypothetical protein
MKRRHIVLFIGLALAAETAIFGDKTPAGDVAEAVVRPAAKTAGAVRPLPKPGAAAEVSIDSLRPRSRPATGDELGTTTAAPEKALFGTQSWTPPAPLVVAPAAVPIAPSAPPLPFTYLGKSLTDGTWEVFLGRGDRTIIVQDKSVIDATYRVDAIRPPLLLLTYLPLNQAQQLTIGVID